MPYVRALRSFVGLPSHEVLRWKRYHKSWIELWLVYRGRTYRCGRCGKGFRRRHDEEPIRVRDLDIGPHRVVLWLPRYRVRCPRCGICRVKSVIVRPGARCTRRFERTLFVVKTIKKSAYGFHDWEYFRLKILRKCGKLADPSSQRD